MTFATSWNNYHILKRKERVYLPQIRLAWMTNISKPSRRDIEASNSPRMKMQSACGLEHCRTVPSLPLLSQHHRLLSRHHHSDARPLLLAPRADASMTVCSGLVSHPAIRATRPELPRRVRAYQSACTEVIQRLTDTCPTLGDGCWCIRLSRAHEMMLKEQSNGLGISPHGDSIPVCNKQKYPTCFRMVFIRLSLS